MKLRFQLPRISFPRRNKLTTHHHPAPFNRSQHVDHPTFDFSHLTPSRSARRAADKRQRAARTRHSNLINHRRHSR